MHFKDTTYRGVRMLSLCGAFMGLLTDFPILVCDLASGTIIGTDVLPHTLDTRNGLLFTEGAPRYSCTVGMQRSPAAFSQLATAPFPLIQRMYYIVPFILLADVLFPLVGCWRTSPFSHKTMVVVGRTLVDPSWWSVLVLVSNFSQDTVMVEPFSEVGMLTQISTIQSVTETMDQPPCSIESLPMHLCDLLDQTSRDLDEVQRRQLAGVLLRYTDLFPIPDQH